MCEYCRSYWTTCQNCSKALCRECTTGTHKGDMCPDCARELEDEEDV